MSSERQIIYNLVAGDEAPPLPVRFLGLDLADYSAISMHVKRADGSTISRTVTPIGVGDPELGTVAWQTGDLVLGRHQAEFELTLDSKPLRLPRKYPVFLDVRESLG